MAFIMNPFDQESSDLNNLLEKDMPIISNFWKHDWKNMLRVNIHACMGNKRQECPTLVQILPSNKRSSENAIHECNDITNANPSSSTCTLFTTKNLEACWYRLVMRTLLQLLKLWPCLGMGPQILSLKHWLCNYFFLDMPEKKRKEGKKLWQLPWLLIHVYKSWLATPYLGHQRQRSWRMTFAQGVVLAATIWSSIACKFYCRDRMSIITL